MKIGKYEFISEEQANKKIKDLGVETNEDGIEYTTHNHTVVKLGYIVLEQGEYDEDGNEAKIYFNGVLKNTSNGVPLPSNLDSLSFSNRTEDGRNFEGKVHDVRVYDRVLTEAEAIELTT